MDGDRHEKRKTVQSGARYRRIRLAFATFVALVVSVVVTVALLGNRGTSKATRRNIDITRSQRHKAVLTPSLTYVLNMLHATGRYPAWFGDPTQVGKSPFDYALPEEWQTPTKWLFRLPVPDHSLESSEADMHANDLVAAVRSYPSFMAETVYGDEALHGSHSPDILVDFAAATSVRQGGEVPSHRSPATHVRILSECEGVNCIMQMAPRTGAITLTR